MPKLLPVLAWPLQHPWPSDSQARTTAVRHIYFCATAEDVVGCNFMTQHTKELHVQSDDGYDNTVQSANNCR